MKDMSQEIALEPLGQVLNWDFLPGYQLWTQEQVNRMKHLKIDVSAHLGANYATCRPFSQKEILFFSTVERGQRGS